MIEDFDGACLIEDPVTGLVDGYYFDLQMAVDARESWSERLGRTMHLKILQAYQPMPEIPDHMMLNEVPGIFVDE